MSGTLLATRSNVRLLIHDTDINNYACGTQLLNRLIEDQMELLGDAIGFNAIWSTGAITLVNGTTDYTLPTTVEYDHVAEMRLSSLNMVLSKLPLHTMETLRNGPGTQSGDPVYYALWEGTDQKVNVRFFPTPNKADTVDVFRSTVPTALASDASTIPFRAPMLRALERRVALEALAGMVPEQREQKEIAPDVTALWQKDVSDGIAREKRHLMGLKMADGVVREWA